MKKIIRCLLIMTALAGCGSADQEGLSAQNGLVPKTPNPIKGMEDSSGPGNGGGAIVRNGSILTLAQAGVSIPIAEVKEPTINIPEISIVEALIERLALTDSLRGSLLGALFPSGVRKYFDIKAADLNPEKKAKLLAEYYSAIGQSVPEGDEFTLVAITIGSETYLLPEFHELSDSISRAAILFHEVLWVKNPKLPLRSVIAAEIAIENLLRSEKIKQRMIYDSELFLVLSDALEDSGLGVSGAIKKDLEGGTFVLNLPTANGVQKKVYHSAVISIRDLLGNAAVESLRTNMILDRLLVGGYWYRLSKANPSILFLKELTTRLDVLDLYLAEGYDFVPLNNHSGTSSSVRHSEIGSEIFDLSGSQSMDLSPHYVIDKDSILGEKWRNYGSFMPKQYWARFGIDETGKYPDYSWVRGFYASAGITSQSLQVILSLKPYWLR